MHFRIRMYPWKFTNQFYDRYQITSIYLNNFKLKGFQLMRKKKNIDKDELKKYKINSIIKINAIYKHTLKRNCF